MKCDLCGRDLPQADIKHVHIKGKVKNICEECATAVTGLM